MVSVIFQPLYPRGNSQKYLANWGIGWFSELVVKPVQPLFCHYMFWNESLGNVLTESLLQPAPLLTRIREVPCSVLNRDSTCGMLFLLFLSRYKGFSNLHRLSLVFGRFRVRFSTETIRVVCFSCSSSAATEASPNCTAFHSYSGSSLFGSQPRQYLSWVFLAFPQPLQRRRLYFN